jgi:predicted dehydrogenase
MHAVTHPVRWGVLGAAAIAVGRTMPALKEAPSASLVALASRRAEAGRKLAQSLHIERLYTSYEDLLADRGIDAVYIPLPNALHFDWSVRALESGKHVLCEKPLCLESQQVGALCAVRDRTGRHIEEAFVYRNHPQWDQLAQLLASKAIGEIRAVHATLAKQFLDPRDIRNHPNGGGGGLYDLGSYAISACNLIAGRTPQRVVAALEIDPQFGIDRLSTALLDYGDAHATLTVATQSGPAAWATHQQLTVLGSNGWLRLNFPFAQARPVGCSIEIGDDSSVGGLPTTTLAFEPVNQYALQVERFSRYLLGEPVRHWPIEEALGTLRTIEALFESARSGTWISPASR